LSAAAIGASARAARTLPALAAAERADLMEAVVEEGGPQPLVRDSDLGVGMIGGDHQGLTRAGREGEKVDAVEEADPSVRLEFQSQAEHGRIVVDHRVEGDVVHALVGRIEEDDEDELAFIGKNAPPEQGGPSVERILWLDAVVLLGGDESVGGAHVAPGKKRGLSQPTGF